ncbi:MAG: M20/M25/M40 family metallo-hydrolase [Bacteroidia bacterium]
MKNKNTYILPLSAILLALHFFIPAFGQKIDKKAVERIKKDVYVLADDAMQGREAGTPSELQAALYISTRFMSNKLLPKGSQNYFKPFEFRAETNAGENNVLTLNTKTLKFKNDFYPLSYSSSGTAKGKLIKAGFGIIAPELNYNDYKDIEQEIKGNIAVIEVSSPDGIHPHSKYLAYHDLAKRIETAKKMGAVAIIFINSDKKADDPEEKLSNKIISSEIPVIFARGMAYKIIMDATEVMAEINTDIIREERVGWNVIGYLDNKAKNTIVIGAHYDHLGWGDEHSAHRGEKAIHNGADDNASGVATMIEIVHQLRKNKKTKNNNYLFIAFSGEEKGLFGSASYVKDPTIDLSTVNYMINLDMVGRLDPKEKKLGINAVGTSPIWKELINNVPTSMQLKLSEPGIGPSDHTSFYLQNIPVLHFFSGMHGDYHKPSDDAEKLNYEGAAEIADFIVRLIEAADSKGKLPFSKTKEEENARPSRMKVTLGIMPDYMHTEKGIRIEGITEGKAAEKAGLLKGDIILKIGNNHVNDMGSYMKALSEFNKGDKTNITILRGNETIVKEVEF